MSNMNKSWCFTFSYAGKKPAKFGTVVVRADATQQEVEAECWKAWDEIFPDGFEKPKLTGLVPGMLIFVEEEE